MIFLNALGVATPLLVCSLALAYKFFKLPKQDLKWVRMMMYKNDKPIVLGHRAGHFEAPENTCVGIKTAAENGATGVEIDLDFSKDGVPILFHDEKVNRVTNGTGKVCEMSFEELRKLNAAVTHPYVITKKGKENISFANIPTLSEAVRLCIGNNLMIDLDVKSNPGKVVESLKALLKEHPNAPEFMFVTSFYPDIVYRVRKECPEFIAGLIWRHYIFSRTIAGPPRYVWYLNPFYEVADKVFEHLVHHWLPDFLGISLLVLNKKHLSEMYLDNWREKGVEVIAWTVNNPLEKEFLLSNQRVPIVTDSLLNSEECGDQTT